uniref:Uncharacterized protein n=1 Tax=Craspedostauros australis TaxID=1486917 RepID=A0A7R9WUY9_9STRA|mmetsp:Transcript_22029/g.61296  ORF Transcript_22029/g.61296 Transcript_22029/m.61296 type:complete len:194 (+) Transcript_22029:237-818(+)
MSLMLLRSLWRQWRQSGLPWNIFIECLHGIHPRTHDIATDVAPAAVDADVDAADAADGVTVTAANDENIKSHGMPTSTTSTVAHPSISGAELPGDRADQLQYAPCVSHCCSTRCYAMRSTLLRVSSILCPLFSWTRSARRDCFLSVIFHPPCTSTTVPSEISLPTRHGVLINAIVGVAANVPSFGWWLMIDDE